MKIVETYDECVYVCVSSKSLLGLFYITNIGLY
jgi:hypothetical protein